jgi:hypothetical protein
MIYENIFEKLKGEEYIRDSEYKAKLMVALERP